MRLVPTPEVKLVNAPPYPEINEPVAADSNSAAFIPPPSSIDRASFRPMRYRPAIAESYSCNCDL